MLGKDDEKKSERRENEQTPYGVLLWIMALMDIYGRGILITEEERKRAQERE